MKTGKIFGDGNTGVNQLLPHKHKWAYDMYKIGTNNNWSPTEIGMTKDIEQWKNSLSDDEKLLVKRCLGFFAGSESLVSNNLLLTIFKYVEDPECRQYIIRQMFEESIHNETVMYVCDSLGLDVSEVYEAYCSIPSIKAKDDFLMALTDNLQTEGVSPQQKKQNILRNIITYYIVCEGIFFYCGFAMLLAFGRQNKLPGLCEQIQYTVRDESVHVSFGVKLIQTIIQQEPEIWTREFVSDTINHIEKTVELEVAYAKDALPRGVLGLRADLFLDYVRYIANRRLEQLGLKPIYKGARNPFNWMTETIDLRKQKNFFETRVTEYATNALVNDL